MPGYPDCTEHQCQDTPIALKANEQAPIGAKKPRYLDCPLHCNVRAKTITMVLLMVVVVLLMVVVVVVKR